MNTEAFEQFAESEEPDPLEDMTLDPHFKSDVGFADAFAERFGKRVRYIAEEGMWLVFDPRRGWRRDNTGEARALFAAFAREIYTNACERAKLMEDAKAGAAAIAAAAMLGNRKRIDPALAFASVNRSLVVSVLDLDREPYLLGVKNGVIDLRDGSFSPHSRDILVSRQCSCDYDPEAKCPTFEGFLETVQPDPEMRGFLQRLAGYSLTGYIGEHILPFHYGCGANGKGTFLEQTLFKLLGSYAAKLTDSLVYVDKKGGVPYLEIAGLCGIRFALGEENAEGGSLNEGLLKKMTGGDRQKGRFHYKSFVEYDPTAKIHLVGNHRPHISGRDDGIWRRFRLVDWPVKIPTEKQDLQFAEKLADEFSGVLNWAIAGCLALGQRGTRPPESVLASTSRFREDSDSFGDFLREKTIDDLDPVTGKIGKGELFKAYKEYCEEQELPPKFRQTKRKVGFLMVERGYDEGRSNSTKEWLGITTSHAAG